MYNCATMKPACFLDRDGVIIENRSNYVRSLNDIEFYPAAIQALARYSASPYLFIIVTNQSAVGRGLVSLETAEIINKKIVEELVKNGCRIDGVLMCPHKPEDNCACRKPKPGLLIEASQIYSINLAKSLMIGDAWTDLLAGNAAGVSDTGLVLTGRGQKQLELGIPRELSIANVFKDLAEALDRLFN